MTIRTDALPALQQAVANLGALVAQYGVGVKIADFGGTRTQADDALIHTYRDQDYAQYVANGGTASIDQFRPMAAWGTSYHDFGGAYDLVAIAPSGMTQDAAQKILGEMAGDVGLTWGGYWSNADPAHFQLNSPLDQVKQDWADYTGGTMIPHMDAPSGMLTIALVAAVILVPIALARRRGNT